MSGAVQVTGREPGTGAGAALTLSDGRITARDPCDAPDDGILAPGLIDLQVNGFAGHDLNDGALTPETVKALCSELARHGVTAFLPTLITASQEAICDALSAIRAALDDPLAGRMIAGVHVEGPAVSPEDGPRGAHPAQHVRPLTEAEVDAWRRASGGLLRMVTLAPEWPGSEEIVRGLAASGIHVAIGHTAATAEQIHAAAAAGATLSTHLGNGAAGTLPRHPNFIWAQLADDRLTASFIADGHHLPADTFRAMLRAKGSERSILVSDSVALAGMPPGRYSTPVGGEVEVHPGGRISLAGTEYLAGAGIPLVACLGEAMRMAGLGLAEVLRLATANPARFAGREGTLAPEARADILRLDETPDGLAVGEVWIAGERVAP